MVNGRLQENTLWGVGEEESRGWVEENRGTRRREERGREERTGKIKTQKEKMI